MAGGKAIWVLLLMPLLGMAASTDDLGAEKRQKILSILAKERNALEKLRVDAAFFEKQGLSRRGEYGRFEPLKTPVGSGGGLGLQSSGSSSSGGAAGGLATAPGDRLNRLVERQMRLIDPFNKSVLRAKVAIFNTHRRAFTDVLSTVLDEKFELITDGNSPATEKAPNRVELEGVPELGIR